MGNQEIRIVVRSFVTRHSPASLSLIKTQICQPPRLPGKFTLRTDGISISILLRIDAKQFMPIFKSIIIFFFLSFLYSSRSSRTIQYISLPHHLSCHLVRHKPCCWHIRPRYCILTPLNWELTFIKSSKIKYSPHHTTPHHHRGARSTNRHDPRLTTHDAEVCQVSWLQRAVVL